MSCQKLALVTLAVLGLGLPAQAEGPFPFLESEVEYEVPLPEGRAPRTDELFSGIVAPPEGELCFFLFFDGRDYYASRYEAHFGDEYGRVCEAERNGQRVVGIIGYKSQILNPPRAPVDLDF